MCLHHSVALSQLNVTGINFNVSSITAVVDQEACVIIHGVHLVHLAMFLSGSQHVAGPSVRATNQGQAL